MMWDVSSCHCNNVIRSPRVHADVCVGGSAAGGTHIRVYVYVWHTLRCAQLLFCSKESLGTAEMHWEVCTWGGAGHTGMCVRSSSSCVSDWVPVAATCAWPQATGVWLQAGRGHRVVIWNSSVLRVAMSVCVALGFHRCR